MMEIVKKRRSCPLMVQSFWDAIESICQSRNCPNFERLSAHVKRNTDVKDTEIKRQLDYAVQDELVRFVTRVSNKGPAPGDTQESYRMPDDDKPPGSNDWYCFECHRSGEVACCSTCHRVYHPFCLKEDLDPTQAFVCAICKMCAAPTFQLGVEELNRLLIYTCNRLNEKVKGDVSYPCLSRRPGLPSINTKALEGESLVQPPNKEGRQRLSRTEEECWRQSHLIYYYVDLVIMESKARNQKYRCLEEFQADAMSIVHNVVIFCGVLSDMADLAKYMYIDCIYDLNEIRQCKDCYRMSNEKPDRYWFCQPCDPPHELVFAKQMGFPYWPAKVIKVEGDIFDVRFFGGCYQRADIERRSIRSIDVNLNSLNIKKSLAWTKACEEMRYHQQLLGKKFPKIEIEANATKKKRKRVKKTETKPKRAKLANPLEPQELVEIKQEPESVTESEGEASQNESSISSTTKSVKSTTTADDYNVVSSSCQEASSAAPQHITIGTQTRNQSRVRRLCKHTQVNMDLSLNNVSAKPLKKMRDKMLIQFRADKDKAVKEITARLERKNAEDKEQAVAAASAATKASFQSEVDRMRKQIEAKCLVEHRNEMEMIMERNRCLLSEVKKKQWCYHCGSEAIYHCCWNTSYCSTECQQSHWQKEHKRSCRRKR